MLSQENLFLDIIRAMCATAWIMFFLIIKNIVLIIILAVERRKRRIYQTPEDLNAFGSGHQPTESNDHWSLAGRIQKILANDSEYVPYFLILIIVIFCTISLTSQANHLYLARVLIYGIIFTVSRYLHTISYLIGNSYGRIIGFLLTTLILVIISVDHGIYMTKRLHDYVPNSSNTTYF